MHEGIINSNYTIITHMYCAFQKIQYPVIFWFLQLLSLVYGISWYPSSLEPNILNLIMRVCMAVIFKNR